MYHSSLSLLDLPDQIYEKLKKEAKLKHRSLAQQAVITLAKGLEADHNPREKRTLLLDNADLDLESIKEYRLSDPVKVIREDRER